LDGEGLTCLGACLDGVPLASTDFEATPQQFRLLNPPNRPFLLEVTTRIHPERNTALEGLYMSQGAYMTQCESEGFRHITYFYDRPDVMTRYAVRIEADATQYPYLLSNGNCIGSGTLPEGRHWVEWEDPFPKPSYLFALVAGSFARLVDTFLTSEGRTVQLQIYAHPHDIDRCRHAMSALQRSMKWDEDRFGRACDLDEYKIVVARDFNFGAMENKGLNIFNHALVVGDSQISSDEALLRIDHVVAHEYFHNWTGNRVTCRDWFQLCLKEGLTVFREHAYAKETGSHAIQRICQVQDLLEHQFPEDGGPLSHPPRPDRYMEISNFYTSTVYEKGGEIFGMLEGFLGKEAFRKGLDAYFIQYDGMAVTIEDLISILEKTTGISLQGYLPWFTHAGTPHVTVESSYNATTHTYTLTFQQRVKTVYPQGPVTFQIPISFSLLGPAGEVIPVSQKWGEPKKETHIYELCSTEESLTFSGISEKPVPCFLQGFSAPVALHYAYTDTELEHLFAYAQDPYCRWEAGQRLWKREFRLWQVAKQEGKIPHLSHGLSHGLQVLLESSLDPAFIALCVELPSFASFSLDQSPIQVEDTIWVREGLERAVAETFETQLWDLYHRHSTDLGYTAEGIAARRLKNVALCLLANLDIPRVKEAVWHQLAHGSNMTDQGAALGLVAEWQDPKSEEALAQFYSTYQTETGVVDLWLQAQGKASRIDTLARIESHLQNASLEWGNPNRIRALVGSFCRQNHRYFHHIDGTGYAFCAKMIISLDSTNPKIATALLRQLVEWKRYDTVRQALIKKELEGIAKVAVSKDVQELVTKALL